MTRQIEDRLLFSLENSPLDRLKSNVNSVQALAGKRIKDIIGSSVKDALPKDFPLTGNIDIEKISTPNNPDLQHVKKYDLSTNEGYVVTRIVSKRNPSDKYNQAPEFTPIPRNSQPEEILRIISDTEWIKYGSKVIKIFEEIAMENKNGKKTIPPLPIPQIE